MGQQRINIGADLNHAAADENRKEIADDGANVFGLTSKRELQTTQEFQHRRQLYRDLKQAACDRSPCGEDHNRVLSAPSSKVKHAGDHGNVPEDGGGIGDEKLAMTVENAKAPSRSDEQARARKQYAYKQDRKLSLFAPESGRDGLDQPGCCENTEQNEERGAQREKRRHSAGSLASFFLVAAGKKIGIDRYEGSGKLAFAEEVLQKVGDAQGRFEHVGGVGIAKIVGEDTVTDEAGDAAEEDACGNEKGKASRTGWLRSRGRGFGHKIARQCPFRSYSSSLACDSLEQKFHYDCTKRGLRVARD